jgi:hypothetical protein
VIQIDTNGIVWMGWKPADAIEVSFVPRSAGLKGGEIVDRGFYDDAVDLLDAALKAEHRR